MTERSSQAVESVQVDGSPEETARFLALHAAWLDQDDQLRARVLMTATVVFMAGALSGSLVGEGYTQGLRLVEWSQLLALLASLVAIPAMALASRRSIRDRIGTLWLLIVAALAATELLFGLPRIAHPGAVLFVASTLMLMPLSLHVTVPAALLVVAGASVNLVRALAEGAVRDLPVAPNAAVLVCALALGIWSARHLAESTRARRARKHEALTAERNVEALSRLLPVCAWCGQVRDDQGYWHAVDAWLRERGIGRRAATLCAECAARSADADPAADDEALPPDPLLAEPVRLAEPCWRRPDPDLGVHEAAYLADHQAERFRPAVALALCAAGFLVLNVAGYAVLHGAASFLRADQLLRLLLLAASLVAAGVLLRQPSERVAMRTVGAWIWITSFALVLLLIAGPRSSGVGVPVFFALAALLLLPLGFWARMAPALIVGAFGLADVFHVGESVDSRVAIQAAFAVVLAIGIGGWASVQLRYSRRRAWAEFQRLLQARARIAELEQRLPICGRCHRIRSERGYWEELFSWLGAQRDVVTTHGICPSCRAAHFPDAARTHGT